MSFEQFKFMGPGGLIEQDWYATTDDEAAQIKLVFQKPIVFVVFVDGEDSNDDGRCSLNRSCHIILICCCLWGWARRSCSSRYCYRNSAYSYPNTN